MYGHRTFLMIRGGAADLKSLIEGGYEIAHCRFSFEQGVNDKGKATTRVHSGTLQITISQLPHDDLIEWALNPRKYTNGVIVLLDAENMPVEKVLFENATCIDFGIEYILKGESYVATKFVIQAEKLIVADDIEFDNKWIYD
jgi:hypothetical protein